MGSGFGKKLSTKHKVLCIKEGLKIGSVEISKL